MTTARKLAHVRRQPTGLRSSSPDFQLAKTIYFHVLQLKSQPRHAFRVAVLACGYGTTSMAIGFAPIIQITNAYATSASAPPRALLAANASVNRRPYLGWRALPKSRRAECGARLQLLHQPIRVHIARPRARLYRRRRPSGRVLARGVGIAGVLRQLPAYLERGSESVSHAPRAARVPFRPSKAITLVR